MKDFLTLLMEGVDSTFELKSVDNPLPELVGIVLIIFFYIKSDFSCVIVKQLCILVYISVLGDI